MRLNYVSFVVSEMSAALAFYRTLGLPVPVDVDTTQGHVEIEVSGLRIAWETEALLRQLNPDWRPPAGSGRVGVAVQAGDPAGVDDAVRRVRAAGYRLITEPFDAPWGQRYASVCDPDGTPVDVFAWLPQ